MTTTVTSLPATSSISTREATTAPPGRQLVGDMVPLADRVRYMQLVRIAAAALVLMAAVVPGFGYVDLSGMAISTAGYMLIVGAGQLVFRTGHSRRLPLFGGLLLADGLYLAWVTQLSGGMTSNLRFLFPLYALAATLLASYRTGLKSTLWSTLTLYAAYWAAGARLLPGPPAPPPAQAWANLVVVIGLLWIVAFAGAVFSSVNERELRRRRYDLQALAQFSRRLEREIEPEAIAAVTLDAFAATCQVRRAVMVARTEAGLRILAHRDDASLVGKTVRESPLLQQCLASHNAVLLRALDPTDEALMTLLPAAHNIVALPLYDERRCIGVVLLERGRANHGRLEQRVLAMMQQFAAHASLALRRAWLIGELRRQAATDSLTGLANRRTFDTTLGRELARTARSGGPVSLLMIDIDHFKQLNDEHGHPTGDAVLRELGAILRQHARPFDTVARYGGEEFAMILANCAGEHALAAAERVRAGIAGGDTTVPVTVSIGIASFPRDGVDASQLIRAADIALYTSKRAGRNRTTCAGAARAAAWS